MHYNRFLKIRIFPLCIWRIALAGSPLTYHDSAHQQYNCCYIVCSFQFLYSYYVLDSGQSELVAGSSIHLRVCVCVHSCPSTQLTQSKVQNEINKWTIKKKKQEKIRCRLSNRQIISFTLRWSPSLFYRFFFSINFILLRCIQYTDGRTMNVQ